MGQFLAIIVYWFSSGLIYRKVAPLSLIAALTIASLSLSNLDLASSAISQSSVVTESAVQCAVFQGNQLCSGLVLFVVCGFLSGLIIRPLFIAGSLTATWLSSLLIYSPNTALDRQQRNLRGLTNSLALLFWLVITLSMIESGMVARAANLAILTSASPLATLNIVGQYSLQLLVDIVLLGLVISGIFLMPCFLVSLIVDALSVLLAKLAPPLITAEIISSVRLSLMLCCLILSCSLYSDYIQELSDIRILSQTNNSSQSGRSP